jgi:2-polyprenyl-3-methyl-5-hydroxy-6-metoxy-1,4-benzoquinol methylase
MYLCKICSTQTESLWDKKKDVTYHRCVSCRFIFLDESAIVDRVCEKKHYEKHNNSFECTGYVKMFDKFISKSILPLLSNLKTALDFGCGHTPVLAELLKREGLEIDYYDFYFFPNEMYKNKKYDLITSTEVFEHLKEPKEVLKTLVNSLSDKGYIVLMTQFPPLNDEEFLNWWYRRDITHISFFTPQSFEIMAEEMGLKVLKTIDNNIVVFQKQ